LISLRCLSTAPAVGMLAGMTDDQPKRGRPSDYSAQVAMTICHRLVDGECLRAICSDAGMPGRATVFRWIARHKEFRDRYTLALEFQAEDLADEILDIADDTSGDWVEKIGADGKAVMVVDDENIARARRRIKALEGQAIRLAPKKYGNRR
jgi:hypothetical protein